jgi:hypothetical protein
MLSARAYALQYGLRAVSSRPSAHEAQSSARHRESVGQRYDCSLAKCAGSCRRASSIFSKLFVR